MKGTTAYDATRHINSWFNPQCIVVADTRGQRRTQNADMRWYTTCFLIRNVKMFYLNKDPLYWTQDIAASLLSDYIAFFIIYSKICFLVSSSYHNLESDNGNIWNADTNYIIILLKTHWCACFEPIILCDSFLLTKNGHIKKAAYVPVTDLITACSSKWTVFCCYDKSPFRINLSAPNDPTTHDVLVICRRLTTYVNG